MRELYVGLPLPRPWLPVMGSSASAANSRTQHARDASDHDGCTAVEVPRVAFEKLTDRRFAALARLTCNADMGPQEVRQFCGVEAAAQRLQLSARAFHRVLKLARTIADLADAEVIAAPHLAEALQYRPKVWGGRLTYIALLSLRHHLPDCRPHRRLARHLARPLALEHLHLSHTCEGVQRS